MSTKFKMAVIGDYSSLLPFSAMGISPFFINSPTRDSVEKALRDILREEFAVVFITEDCLEFAEDMVTMINEDLSTSVVPIPGAKGGRNMGLNGIRSAVERAVGMDIFKVRG